jgi:hypothetical protein
MRRSFRSLIILPQCPVLKLSRNVHSTTRILADTNFTDDTTNIEPEQFESSVTTHNIGADERAYARRVNERSMRRWAESKDPKGKVQFMTMGREFEHGSYLTQLSNMSLNHMRELRAYYRKIMYEMPQFKRTLPSLTPTFFFFVVTFSDFGRIPTTVSTTHKI